MIKKVFVNHDDVIEQITNSVSYIDDDPQFIVDGRKCFYAGNVLKKLNDDCFHDEVEVDNSIVPRKYCYTKENGIFTNPAWHENKYGIDDQLVQNIQDDTIAGLIDMGVL